jgi:glyoxylase-like metal-dependent hydrolase (beta-lactamase superfamily II)
MIDIDWRLIEAGYCLHPEASSQLGASWRPCEFPALVALLRHPRLGWMLFDTGYGRAFIEATKSLPEVAYRWVTPVRWNEAHSVAAQVSASGINPQDIAHVLVSHFHGDHVGALSDFSSAQVWCAQAAWEDLHSRARLQAILKGLLPTLAPRSLTTSGRLKLYEHSPVARLPPELAPFGQAFDIFEDGSIFAVALPGHAAGHFGLCFRSRGKWVFLVADAAWSIRAIHENLPPPRWTTWLLGDTTAYRNTLSSLHALWARQTGVTFVPAHCRTLRP